MPEELFKDIPCHKTVTIPFKAYWKGKLLSCMKTCTTRVSRYGNVGDTFNIFGGTFEITDVVRTKLNTVKNDFYSEEDCATPEVFESAWCSVHPVARFKPELKVYLHFFKRIK